MKTINVLSGFLLAISLGISCQATAQNNPKEGPANSIDCTDKSKASGDSTCMSAVLGYTATQNTTKDFQAIAIKPFANLGASCTTPWGQRIPDNGEVAAFRSATGTYNYSTGEFAGDCVDEQRHCTNGVLSGTFQYQNCTIAPVNARCGVAHGAYYTYPTSGPAVNDQCNPAYTYGGVPPPDESAPSVPSAAGTYLSNNMYYWSCSGEAGGSSTNCYAYRRINGQCGSATNSCDLGSSASPGTRNNYYPDYRCQCSTSTSGTTTCSANPSGNQTCAGAYRDTTYSWRCVGINTGTTASCSSNTYISSNNIPPALPCGAVSQSDSSSCPAGYSGTQRRTNRVDSCTGNILSYGSWNTSSCVSCYSTSSESASCGAGYNGNQTRSVTYDRCSGSTSYGSWNRSSCTVACTTSSSSESQSCGSGYTGTQYRTVTYNSCSGTNYGPWTGTCTPIAPTCTTSTSTESRSCGSGYTGTQSRTVTYNSCSGTNYGGWYGTCTPVPVQPSGCYTFYGMAAIGDTASPCDFLGSGPFPSRQQYRCTVNGWAVSNPGSGTVRDYCQ